MRAFAAGGGLPVALANGAAAAAVQNPHRGVVLLRPVDAVGEVRVGDDAVELAGGLVVVGRPVQAPIGADLGAAVIGDNHAAGVFRRNPEVVVVAVRGVAAFEGAAAVLAFVVRYVHYVEHVLVARVGVDAGVVPGPLAQAAFFIDFLPGLARVVGAEQAALGRFQQRPHPVGVGRRYRDAANAERALGQAFIVRDILPGVAAVHAFPQPRARPARREAVGRAAHVPGSGVQDAWVAGVESEVHGARVAVGEEHAQPGFAAILAAVHPAHVAGLIEVAHGGHEYHVGVFGVNADAADVARVGQPDVGPGLARVGRFPHPETRRHVAAHGFLALAGVNHVGVGLAHGYRANGAAEILIRNVLPGAAAVFGAPHAAARRAHVVEVGLARYARDGAHAPAPVRPNGAPLQPIIQG